MFQDRPVECCSLGDVDGDGDTDYDCPATGTME
jgi:hypothetical protein